MHDTAVVRHRSPLRAAALLLALTVALLSGSMFQTQDRAHAAPLLAAGAVLSVIDLASAAATALTGPSAVGKGVGEVPYYGTQTYAQGGSLDSNPPRIGSPSPSGRAGALVGILATAGSLVLPWVFKSGQPTTYADAPAAQGGSYTISYGTAGSSFSYTARADFVSLHVSGNPTYTLTTLTKGSGSNMGVYFGFQCANGTFSGGWTNVMIPATGGTTAPVTLASQAGCASGYLGRVLRGDSQSSATGQQLLPLGSPPPASTGSPGTTPVTTTTVQTCSNGTTSTSVITYTGLTSQLPAVTLAACTGGSHRTSVQQTSTTPDGRTVTDPIGDWTRPTVPQAYPDCQTTACALELVQLTPGFSGTPDSDPYVCNGRAGCEGALAQPKTGKVVNTRTATDTGLPATDPATWTGTETRHKTGTGREYECRYGPYRVPVAECVHVPIDKPVDTPTQQDPRDDSNCNLSDFSLNPISWVVVPLKCLFIPRDSEVQAASSALSTAWDGTAPATVLTETGKIFTPVVALKDVTPGDCQGPPFTFPSLAGVTEPFTLHPLSTCNELATYLLGIYLPVATAMTYLGGFFTGTRLLLKSAGAESPVKEA